MPTLLRLYPGPRYSEASIHAGTIYLAGQVPTDTSRDIEGQTREVLDMVERLLLEAGSDKCHILMAQLFLSDMADYEGMTDRKFNHIRASIARVLGLRKPLDCLA
ncbi:RidA family protein [Rhodoferax antarcticus]|uniref:RidA family protein n=1 Tax=Rhodoferax antarcticus TaxID=81479 RepID=UPI002223F94A|nr:RidA family protein [Rhodoferax antarcticus]MCW2314113.1 enamine deaminase RidA (YjgF/YER057c/UK114 family) [Rhodoferax antarcticus]